MAEKEKKEEEAAAAMEEEAETKGKQEKRRVVAKAEGRERQAEKIVTAEQRSGAVAEEGKQATAEAVVEETDGEEEEGMEKKREILTIGDPAELEGEVSLEKKKPMEETPGSDGEEEPPSSAVLKGLEEDIRVLRQIRDGKFNIHENKDELDSSGGTRSTATETSQEEGGA